MISIGIIGFFVVVTIVGPLIYQHVGAPYTSHVDSVTYSPSVYHSYYHDELDHQDELTSAQYWLDCTGYFGYPF